MFVRSVLGNWKCFSQLYVKKAAFALFEVARVLFLMRLLGSGNLSCKGDFWNIISSEKSSSKIQVMLLKKSRAFSSEECPAERKKGLLVSSGAVLASALWLLLWPVLATATACHSSPMSLHLLAFATYRSLTFSGVIQEAKGAVHQTRVEEEVVTLVLMSLPSCLKSIIWRCLSGLMNLRQKVMISVTMGR